ncbi:NmrA family NAD(P)-binding protein [Amycolatopsis sp. NPDC048633]|uniref:NmrA family NAD(P)-binding protein n=1 Tax=Amycolatopsis sp. NPDC048633 TaxID=3157095 RepID=UPI0033D72E36
MSTSSTEKRVVAVVGATGRQGGGPARSIAADPDGPFAVRTLTRDAGSPRAKELAAAGAEVVTADLDDPGSVEAAFAGAYGAFCVTAAQERPERETAHAATMAAAARRAGVAHVVWSTFEDTRTLADDRDRGGGHRPLRPRDPAASGSGRETVSVAGHSQSGARDPAETRKLHPGLLTFSRWLSERTSR